jgi:hypothetical protein
MSAVLLLGAPPIPALALPPAFEAEYAVKAFGVQAGRLVMRLTRQGDILRLETQTHPSGLLALFVGDSTVTEQSVLREGDERLELVGFEFSSSVPDKERQLQGRWIADEQALRIVDGDRRLSLEFPADGIDRLGAQLRVMHALEEGARDGTLSVVDLDEVKSISYRVIEEETIRTGTGTYSSLRVRRIDPDSSRVNESWYAPGLSYLPVQMEQRRKKGGKPTRLVLRSLRWLEP